MFVYMNDHLENTLDYSAAELDAWWAQWTRVRATPITETSVDVPLPDPTKHYLFYVRAVNVVGQQGFFTDIVSANDPRFMAAAP